ncbi:hypothetical protein ES703_69603 [subsurface metagenome]
MKVEVMGVDLLIARYGWLLRDSKEARRLVKGWGLTVKGELERVGKMRWGLRRLVNSGTEVM